MTMAPVLDRIILYPIKSLDGIEVSQVAVTPGGTLKHDRMFAIFDQNNQYVNANHNEKIHGLRTHFDLKEQRVTISPRGTDAVYGFDMNDGLSRFEAWLREYLDMPVKLKTNANNGFPDDEEAWGPTIVSTASLVKVTDWFPDIVLEGARARFRANLELTGVPAFWEDHLFGNEGRIVQFRIGDVLFEGVNPCQRCVVPARDPWSGTAIPGFQKTLAQKRRESLPDWSVQSRFDHYYRFAVNTRIPVSEAGKVLSRGDVLEIQGIESI
jgi:uncharacterized protein YcbX